MLNTHTYIYNSSILRYKVYLCVRIKGNLLSPLQTKILGARLYHYNN